MSVGQPGPGAEGLRTRDPAAWVRRGGVVPSEVAGVDEVGGLVTPHESAGRWLLAMGGPLLQGIERVLEARQHGPDQVGMLAVEPLEVGPTLDLVKPGEASPSL